jgi:hypothetical protein
MNQKELTDFMLKASEEDVITYARLETEKFNCLSKLLYSEQIQNFITKYGL